MRRACHPSMAKSRYEYVKKFEQQTVLLPGCWTVVRVDGDKFSSLVKEHNFQKPNDDRGLELMTDCAREVMRRWPEISLAYGHSDEFSMLLPSGCELYGRRAEKLASSFAALFAGCYVHQWGNRIKNVPLSAPPAFDGRAIALPSSLCVRDYFCWRQADCHINNLHNTTYYGLMQEAGLSSLEANQKLKGTSSANKNEILFTLCGINYNDVSLSLLLFTFKCVGDESLDDEECGNVFSQFPISCTGAC